MPNIGAIELLRRMQQQQAPVNNPQGQPFQIPWWSTPGFNPSIPRGPLPTTLAGWFGLGPPEGVQPPYAPTPVQPPQYNVGGETPFTGQTSNAGLGPAYTPPQGGFAGQPGQGQGDQMPTLEDQWATYKDKEAKSAKAAADLKKERDRIQALIQARKAPTLSNGMPRPGAGLTALGIAALLELIGRPGTGARALGGFMQGQQQKKSAENEQKISQFNLEGQQLGQQYDTASQDYIDALKREENAAAVAGSIAASTQKEKAATEKERRKEWQLAWKAYNTNPTEANLAQLKALEDPAMKWVAPTEAAHKQAQFAWLTSKQTVMNASPELRAYYLSDVRPDVAQAALTMKPSEKLQTERALTESALRDPKVRKMLADAGYSEARIKQVEAKIKQMPQELQLKVIESRAKVANMLDSIRHRKVLEGQAAQRIGQAGQRLSLAERTANMKALKDNAALIQSQYKETSKALSGLIDSRVQAEAAMAIDKASGNDTKKMEAYITELNKHIGELTRELEPAKAKVEAIQKQHAKLNPYAPYDPTSPDAALSELRGKIGF